MIIKPNLGGRIFWGVAGGTMFILACAGLGLMPMGLIFTCLGLPIAVFSFGYAFGVAFTRVDDEGVFQRNFFFMSKKFAWGDIENGGIVSQDYNYKDSSGWTSRRTRTFVTFVNKEEKKIHINSNNAGPENWWHEMRRIAKEKLGEKFEG